MTGLHAGGGFAFLPYALAKALHVAAVLAFVGGLLAAALVLRLLVTAPRQGLPEGQRLIAALLAWDRAVTSPALGLTWVLGLYMAATAGWFASGWLACKLALVVGLSALHGLQSGALRRLSAQPPSAPVPAWRHAAPAVIATTALIAWLVVVKPF